MQLRTPVRQSSQPQPETPPVSKFYGSPPPTESTQTPASSAPASPATSQPPSSQVQSLNARLFERPSGLRSLLSSGSLQRDNSQASLDSRATPTQDDINAMMRGVKEAQAEVAEAARREKKKQNHQDNDDHDGGAKPEKKADGDAKPKKNDTKVKKALGG